jgi:tetratricopeptide (TPR) repeat protein
MTRSFMLMALLALAACAPDPAELREKAQAAFAGRDYTAARLHLAEALRAEPADPDLLQLQARTLLALGDGDGAGAALDRLARGRPASGELAEMAAEAALLRGKPDIADRFLAGSSSIEAERLRAQAALQRGDKESAEAALARALAAGGNARAYADMARLAMMRDDLETAAANLRRAEAAAPDAILTLLVAGELAARRGDLAQALSRYDRAVRLYPGNVAALTGQAAILGDLGRFDAMAKVLEPLSRAAPADPAIVYLRARLALARKDWESVRSLIQPLEAGLEAQDPKRLLYGEALLRLGQAEQARAQVVAIARAQPGNRLAVRLLAESLLAAGDAAAAADALRPIAGNPEARPEELALMARIAKATGEVVRPGPVLAPRALAADLAEADAAMRAGNWARAATAYDRILAVTDGRNVLVLNNMAYAQSMLGNHDQAIALADRARRLAAGNASVLDTAGWVRWRAGRDQAEALRLLREAARLAPDNQTIRAHLAEAGQARN